MGLACRRIKGQVRLLTFAYGGANSSPNDTQLIEFAPPAEPGPITSLTNRWRDIWSPGPSPKQHGRVRMLVGGPGQWQ